MASSLEVRTRGPFDLPSSFVGPAYRMIELPVGAMGKYGEITKYTSDWARIGYEKLADRVTLTNVRDAGHEYEGRVKIGGRSYSAFTSGGENPDGGQGMIIVRMPKRAAKDTVTADDIIQKSRARKKR
jgi:hypothetical protein